MWAKLAKHWFLASLAICFAWGYFAAELWRPLLEMRLLRDGIVFVVMWAMGVTLRPDAIRNSLAKPIPSLLAIATNVLLVPLLSLPTMLWLPDRLFGGLFVTAIVPCTLASASVWTRNAGGNDSVAMMTTVVTNLACVVVVPLGIMLVLASHADIDVVAQVPKLFAIVVVPLILAQFTRRLGADQWADRNKTRLSILAQCGMLIMVTFGAATSAGMVGQAAASESTPWLVGALLLLSAVGVHCVALACGITTAKLLHVERESQIAVGIAGSQKTLMVGLQIAIDCGVSVIPMIIYHLAQLVIDTVVVERWKSASAQRETATLSRED
ncbi:MAG: bile acid:sodium symporter family protein [Rubripirellula sp.]